LGQKRGGVAGVIAGLWMSKSGSIGEKLNQHNGVGEEGGKEEGRRTPPYSHHLSPERNNPYCADLGKENLKGKKVKRRSKEKRYKCRAEKKQWSLVGKKRENLSQEERDLCERASC